MRYALQLAEVTAPVADGPLDAAAIEAAAAAFEQRYAALYGADTGFREAAPDPRSSPAGRSTRRNCADRSRPGW